MNGENFHVLLKKIMFSNMSACHPVPRVDYGAHGVLKAAHGLTLWPASLVSEAVLEGFGMFLRVFLCCF